ncbi:hypothetical protein PENSPDRAFT_349559 [Peniophora sp. CONT]|nr:hypothetical protein PENSPDRAFT_349559 [Peniophora sp. CONT]
MAVDANVSKLACTLGMVKTLDQASLPALQPLKDLRGREHARWTSSGSIRRPARDQPPAVSNPPAVREPTRHMVPQRQTGTDSLLTAKGGKRTRDIIQCGERSTARNTTSTLRRML